MNEETEKFRAMKIAMRMLAAGDHEEPKIDLSIAIGYLIVAKARNDGKPIADVVTDVLTATKQAQVFVLALEARKKDENAMNRETAELEKRAFTSEHMLFAKREGYDLGWDEYHKSWFVITPRPLRRGEKHQYYKNIAGAWEVAAIRAGRSINGRAGAATNAATRPSPSMQHMKQPPKR